MNKDNYSPSQLRQQISILQNERNNLEKSLMCSRQKMKKGALVEVYTQCSTPNCRCQKGKKHGPSVYVNVNINGKIVHRYIGKKEDQKVLQSLKKYKEFKGVLIALNKVNKVINLKWRAYRESLTEALN